jgi:hypothetical protein
MYYYRHLDNGKKMFIDCTVKCHVAIFVIDSGVAFITTDIRGP